MGRSYQYKRCGGPIMAMNGACHDSSQMQQAMPLPSFRPPRQNNNNNGDAAPHEVPVQYIMVTADGRVIKPSTGKRPLSRSNSNGTMKPKMMALGRSIVYPQVANQVQLVNAQVGVDMARQTYAYESVSGYHGPMEPRECPRLITGSLTLPPLQLHNLQASQQQRPKPRPAEEEIDVVDAAAILLQFF